MKEEFLNLLKSTNRENINELIDFINKTDFFDAPASTRFHGSREHGLVEHSLKVYEILKENHNHAVENFHVLYKGESMNKEVLHNFVLKFREEYTTKNANIYVYNKSDIANLIDKYPLNDKEAELLLSCTIAESWFTNPTEVYVNLS